MLLVVQNCICTELVVQNCICTELVVQNCICTELVVQNCIFIGCHYVLKFLNMLIVIKTYICKFINYHEKRVFML